MAAYNPFLAEKVKKSEIFSRYPLDLRNGKYYNWSHPRNDGKNGGSGGKTEARETSGKIEGIGDVLSDGPRKFLGSQLIERRESRPSLLGHDRAED